MADSNRIELDVIQLEDNVSISIISASVLTVESEHGRPETEMEDDADDNWGRKDELSLDGIVIDPEHLPNSSNYPEPAMARTQMRRRRRKKKKTTSQKAKKCLGVTLMIVIIVGLASAMISVFKEDKSSSESRTPITTTPSDVGPLSTYPEWNGTTAR